jgi:hypothetical protein
MRCARAVRIRDDGPSRMVKRPTGSGGEPSSPNCGASAGVKARHPHSFHAFVSSTRLTQLSSLALPWPANDCTSPSRRHMPQAVLGGKPRLVQINARYPKEVGGPLIARVSAPQEPDHTVGQQPKSNPKHHFHEYRCGSFVPRAHRQGAKTSGPCHGSQDRGDCVFVFHATSCCSGSAAATQNRLCLKVSSSLICFNLYQVEKNL